MKDILTVLSAMLTILGSFCAMCTLVLLPVEMIFKTDRSELWVGVTVAAVTLAYAAGAHFLSLLF